MKRKIFIILSRVPYPLEKGDKLRAYYQLRELAKRHELIICAISDIPPHPEARTILSEFSNYIYFFRIKKAGIFLRLLKALFSVKPFQLAYFHHKGIQQEIEALVDFHRPHHVFCQLIRTAEYARNIHIDKTIDYQDVFSAGLLRRVNVSPWYKRPLLMAEYKRVSRYEREVFNAFPKKTIISFPDREKIQHPQRDEITVVPNGVDTSYFKPIDTEKKYDVVFTGNMAYPPNVNGAEYLAREIMPLVWKEKPDTRVVIAGANPAPAVKALASSALIITGWVNDMREYYASSRVFVAPMQIGTGLQNKVLEAMAMQLPCITSALANKALQAKEGTEILIGRNAAEYAQHILSLLRDSQMRKKLSHNGYRFVLQNFNWESTTAMLEKVITA